MSFSKKQSQMYAQESKTLLQKEKKKNKGLLIVRYMYVRVHCTETKIRLAFHGDLHARTERLLSPLASIIYMKWSQNTRIIR